MANSNKQIKLAARPVGMVKPEDFIVEDTAVPEPGPGDILVRVIYISLDPAMRGWLNDMRSYVAPVAIGETMRALGLGEVVASNSPEFAVGDMVTGMTGWQEYAVVDASRATKVQPDLAPPLAWLSVLGMPGLTAYFGLLEVGNPQPGETVLVSAAAGAVGSIVGQIAQVKGCRVVGLAGGSEKCATVTQEYGFDLCIDYKSTHSLNRDIKNTCPNGVDVYFDNVGGEVLDTALRRINRSGRIVICGAIATYNDTEPRPGPASYMSLLVNRARMEGFIVFDYEDRYDAARQEMSGWMQNGWLKHREHIVKGLDRAPTALNMLYTGENNGKLVLQISEP